MDPNSNASNQPHSDAMQVALPGSLQRLLTPNDRYSGRPRRRVDAQAFPADAPVPAAPQGLAK